jgi:hypothetical protein
MNQIKKIDLKLKEILKKYGIEDEQKQKLLIIEIINTFTGR